MELSKDKVNRIKKMRDMEIKVRKTLIWMFYQLSNKNTKRTTK